MATVVVMPQVGISVESCILTKWHKKKGDTVKEGDLLFSYETDKASVDEEAKTSGVLLEVLHEEGDDIPCLEAVCIIGEAGEDISALLSESGAAAPKEEAKEEAKEEIKKEEQPAKTESATAEVNKGELKVSPRARNLADKHGVDVRLATPTGPYGRIVEKDIQALIDKGLVFTKAALGKTDDISGITGTGIGGRISIADLNSRPVPAAAEEAAAAASTAEYEAVKMSNIRKFIAKSMTASLSTMAQLTLSASVDATEIMNLRKQFKEKGEALGLSGVTINDMILYAVAKTIQNHKDLNAHLVDDEMRYFRSVNLGIAVDTDRGLIVPTLFGAEKLTLGELSKKAKELISSTQKGTVSPDFLKGATFTITNLGTLDVESFTPVINPPQTGILGVCTVTQKVKVVDGEVKTYPSMGLSLTFDHRALDGAPAARFLKELKQNLENFNLLLAK